MANKIILKRQFTFLLLLTEFYILFVTKYRILNGEKNTMKLLNSTFYTLLSNWLRVALRRINIGEIIVAKLHSYQCITSSHVLYQRLIDMFHVLQYIP